MVNTTTKARMKNMKKLLILTATIALSACACFDSSDEEYQPAPAPVAQPAPAPQPAEQVVIAEQPVENVRVVRRRVRVYDDGYTSPRRVRRIYYRDSAPVSSYREEAPAYRTHHVKTSSCGEYNSYGASECPAKVRVTKEPVEIVYRKTKYTTVYEPKTFKDVSYESEPYTEGYSNTVSVSTSSEVEDDYIK